MDSMTTVHDGPAVTARALHEWPTPVHWFFYAVVGAVTCIAFQCPPLADYIEWMYQGYVVKHLVSGGASVPFYLRNYPVPYAASQLLLGGLDVFIGPVAAGQALVLLYLCLGAWFSLSFARRYELSLSLALPLLACTIVVNSSFWSGYINYQLGLLALLAYLSLPRALDIDARAVLLFGLLAFLCHAFILLALGLLVGIKAFARGRRAVLSVSLALLPVLLLTGWYVLARNRDALHLPKEDFAPYMSLRFWAYKFYTLAKAGPYHNFWVQGHGDYQRAFAYYLVGVAANVAFAFFLLAALVHAFRQPSGAGTRELTLAAAALLTGYVLAPAQALGVVNPGERLLYPALLCVFAVALRKDGFGPAALRRTIGPLTYAMMFSSVLGLVLVDRALVKGPPVSAQAFQQRLYWHRPLQFADRCSDLGQLARTHRAPSLPLIFPSSIVGDR
jgi:hypothetical protein